ncbi:helix-turn-helix transcriptional regulator [Geobacillus stearothermophilus]|nr:helix-turn-helix transcriptional regulator [Geobacillus stearothermophilus]
MEAGLTSPRAETLFKISQALNIPFCPIKHGIPRCCLVSMNS